MSGQGGHLLIKEALAGVFRIAGFVYFSSSAPPFVMLLRGWAVAVIEGTQG